MSKTAFVYEWLKEEILSGSMTPGSRIRQQQVASALGVSFTPVREAIRQLQATGLITYESNRGSAVNVLSVEAIRELYLLRGAVEGLGARLAANEISAEAIENLAAIHDTMSSLVGEAHDPSQLASLSREFHSVIVQSGAPLVVYPKVREIWTHYPVPRSQSLWWSPEHAQRSMAAHAKILEALRRRDGDAAGALMQNHIVDGAALRLP